MTKQHQATISYFNAGSGLRLYHEWWVPERPKAMLVIVHGLGEHCGRYGPLIRYFFQRGYGVAVYDQRGHGQSEGTRGHLEHFQDALGDLAAFVQHTKAAHPHVPTYLVGHSFGGQLALNFVVRYSKGLRGMILSSPNIAIKVKIPQWKYWLADVAHRWAPRYVIKERIPGALLSRDPVIADAYEKDPRVARGVTTNMISEIVRNLDIVMALAPRIHLPCFFLQAGDDQICDGESTRQFYRRVPVSRKRLKVYDNFYHELFNEIGKEDVFHDMDTWLSEHLAEERHGERSGGSVYHAMRRATITGARVAPSTG